ncbi:MAG: hypothetical protein K9G62_08275 [Alphaproteobacteria bacterium]|nr:hypothetical protein [Alphaproteobacteria bacterium]
MKSDFNVVSIQGENLFHHKDKSDPAGVLFDELSANDVLSPDSSVRFSRGGQPLAEGKVRELPHMGYGLYFEIRPGDLRDRLMEASREPGNKSLPCIGIINASFLEAGDCLTIEEDDSAHPPSSLLVRIKDNYRKDEVRRRIPREQRSGNEGWKRLIDEKKKITLPEILRFAR